MTVTYKMTSRNWCYTLFSDENVKGDRKADNALEKSWPGANKIDFDSVKHLRFVVQQKEKCPETGKKHIQGYAEFKMPVRFSAVQKMFGEKCHCEIRKGSQQEAIDYCEKEDSRVYPPFRWGSPAQKTGGCNSKAVVAWIREHSLTCSYKDYVEEFETEFIRYGNNMEKLWHMFKYKPKSFLHGELLPVQDEMISMMDEQDDRDIPWVCDDDGGCGKSALCDFLIDRGDVFWASTGGYKDVFHAYSKDPKPFVVMDLTREEGQEDKKIGHVYGILEAFKNGKAFSGKYDSTSLSFPKPKVLVLANTVPNPGKWSSKGIQSRYKSVRLVSRGEGNTILTPLTFCDIEKKFFKKEIINLEID